MIIVIAAAITISALIILYKRYFPVFGVPSVDPVEMLKNEGGILLDIRDYNVGDKNSVQKAETIPLAYLTRHYSQVSGKHVYIIAPDKTARNLSIRFMRSKGYVVLGYYLMKEEPAKHAAVKSGRTCTCT